MKKVMKHILLILFSLAVAAFFCQYKGDTWEEKIRLAFYALRNDSIPSFSKTLADDKGVPYVHYASTDAAAGGNRYNATIVANYAIDYYQLAREKKDTIAASQFMNCINWLAGNITYKNGYALYAFNWRQPFYEAVGAPWTSGMTSGRAIEAFTLAYDLTRSNQWLDLSMALTRGFYQPIQSGGFTYKEANGWWFEEFADSNGNTPRVLDGHIYALLGVYRFWKQTKNDSAAYVFQQGLAGLIAALPAYDPGNGMIYYDAHHTIADRKYHLLIISLMKELHAITGNPVFDHYYAKWNAPLIKPYVYRIAKEKNRSGWVLFIMLSSFFYAFFYFGYTVFLKRSRSQQ